MTTTTPEQLTWHRVLSLDELPEGRVKTVSAGPHSFAMAHYDGRYAALSNRCPHQGGPLGEGSIEKGMLRCPWQGYDYCPLDGSSPFGDSVPTFPTDVRDDGIYVGMEPDKPHLRTVTDVMAETMVNWGVRHVFGMVGHSNLGLADALRRQEEAGKPTYIGIRHEGAAAFAAFGKVARWTQPVLETSKHAELMTLACKHAILQQGPAHLIFPDEVQTLAGGDSDASGPGGRLTQLEISPPAPALDRAAELLDTAKRPVIIVGHGARFHREQVITLAERIGAPVITTRREHDDRGRGVNSAIVFAALGRHVPEDAVIAVDVGNHAYSFGRYFECKPGQSVLMSGYPGSIGFGYPAAIGAWAAAPDRPIFAVTGDGGFGQYMAELLTAVKHNMKITHVLLNNGQLGKIAKEQRADGPSLIEIVADPDLI
jgi:thiamine pyrophosphate-dependent acetolactate synthase large subunit-like protein/nitrite reductase/ring-hydroxylating ferredoxin subunit